MICETTSLLGDYQVMGTRSCEGPNLDIETELVHGLEEAAGVPI